ncbi:heterokaryon incompatibility protein-domain-containing protein [Echria macrotheca]|uniref:Heterokaryon incompatibility protein-domain-containing protein n=1 Tax=Echria macrotheca TaxID=438768 RepID=A0AAJ0F9H3_9PEZI|nr:heterokaryon incompatibility protein-domain-containing protein [Echria macrotheca]
MNPPVDQGEDCAICGTFVAALKTLYSKTLRSGIAPKRFDPKCPRWHHFDWTLRDRPPSLPRLSKSARSGCPRCALLKSAIVLPRRHPFGNASGASGTGEKPITLRFYCIGNPRITKTQMPLKDIQELFITVAASATETSPKSGLGTLHVLRSDDFAPFSDANVKLARDAIDGCVKIHQSCPGPEPTPAPLRLLNVMHGDHVKLEKTDGKNVTYAALSYCWGSSKAAESARTMADNVNERADGLALTSLPKTLRDAIAVTRLLKIRYLWIDALCIVQDCQREWTSEAQKMMEYYGHARVTIVPVEADSADSGMRTDRGTPVSCRVRGPWNSHCGSDLVLSGNPPGGKKSIAHSAWNKRGWTYQERLNSSRILYIFGHNMTLECREGFWDTLTTWSTHKREDWSRFLPTTGTEMSQTLERLNRDWFWLVQCYTERRLSNPKDRWFAFSGISHAFSRGSGRDVIAGLWKDRILEDIVSWRCRRKAPRKRSRKSSLGHSAASFRHGIPPVNSPHCFNCGTAECRSSASETPEGFSLPSWTWLGTQWSDKSGGVPLSKTAIEQIKEGPRSHLLDIIAADGDVQCVKLKISGLILPRNMVLDLLAHSRDLELSIQGLGPRDTGVAYLDDSYDTMYSCRCKVAHSTADCGSRNAVLELSPPVKAILIGIARFQAIPDASYWHFLLIQPTGSQQDGVDEYHRVGTMHFPADHVPKDVEDRLNIQKAKTFVLV